MMMLMIKANTVLTLLLSKQPDEFRLCLVLPFRCLTKSAAPLLYCSQSE